MAQGSMLKWLNNQVQSSTERYKLYDKYLGNQAFAHTSPHLEDAPGRRMPDFVSDISVSDNVLLVDTSSSSNRSVSRSNDELYEIMQASMGEPQLFEPTEESNPQEEDPRSALFPYCFYDNDKENEGIRTGPYGESYCRRYS